MNLIKNLTKYNLKMLDSLDFRQKCNSLISPGLLKDLYQHLKNKQKWKKIVTILVSQNT